VAKRREENAAQRGKSLDETHFPAREGRLGEKDKKGSMAKGHR